jgi:hypothetical protein
MSKLKYVKNAIYRLKQRMGLPIAYHVIDQHSVDTETGIKNTVLRVINIKKAIVLQTHQLRSLVYDIAYLSANKDFTEGGYFDSEDRRVIIQTSDLNGLKPNISDYIIFENVRYDIKEIKEYENNYSYEFRVRKIRGQEITRIVSRLSGLILTQSVSAIIVDKLSRVASNEIDFTQSLVENP